MVHNARLLGWEQYGFACLMGGVDSNYGCTCSRSKKKSDFFGAFGCERLPVFVSGWSFKFLQRSYGSL